MSTQDGASIEFSIAQNFTNFQLVELPEEIIQMIAEHKSDAPVLELKSDATSGNAVLCSTNKTFPIRSVHTSNSLYVAQPTTSSEQDQDQDQDCIPSYGIQAISSTGVTLELSQSTESALPYLRKALPIYSSRDLNAAEAVKSSFETVCRDIPLSNGEVQDAWSMLCAFEEQGASYRPTANILLQLWKAITTAAFADNIDLSKAFLVEDLWTSIKDEEFPRGMFDVFLHRVEDRNSMDVDADSKWCTIDNTRCSKLIGALVLETRTASGQKMAVSDFLDALRANLLENWHDIVSLELVQDIATQASPATIALGAEHRLSGTPASGVQTSETNGPTKARKWHEKFKKGKT